MDQPLLLMFGMIVISTLLFVLSRNLCRDPEAIHAEVEHEQQRALAEAMVRNMDTHELVAIASGRVSAGLTGSSRSQQRSRVAVDEEQRAGISEETRMSFVKLSAGRSGYAPEVVSIHRVDISHDGEISLQALPKSANRSGSAERLDDVPLSSSSSMAEPVGPPSEEIISVVREEAAKAVEPVSEPIEVPSGAYSDNTCSICLDDYEEGDQLLQLTCGHVFHRPCIDLWLKSHRVCPCCRTDLDQLAQVAQVFPTRGRRSLQKALARAEGNIAAAVELLLSQERNSEGVDRVVDLRGAFSASQALGRNVGMRRVPVEGSIGDHGSPFGNPNGTLVERTVLGDGYASGATSNDGARTRDAFRRRAEYRPGFSMTDTIRHTYMRTIAREAEPENATNVPMVAHAPLPTVMENPVEETVEDGMRPRQAVVTVVSRSLTESSSQATASPEERGGGAENPPLVRVSEARDLAGARGSGTCRFPRPSAIMRIGKRYPSAAGNASSVADARVADMASGTRRSLAPPSYAEAMSGIATRRPSVVRRTGSSSFGGEDAMGGGFSGVEVEVASGVRSEGVTSPAAEPRVSAE